MNTKRIKFGCWICFHDHPKRMDAFMAWTGMATERQLESYCSRFCAKHKVEVAAELLKAEA